MLLFKFNDKCMLDCFIGM